LEVTESPSFLNIRKLKFAILISSMIYLKECEWIFLLSNMICDVESSRGYLMDFRGYIGTLSSSSFFFNFVVILSQYLKLVWFSLWHRYLFTLRGVITFEDEEIMDYRFGKEGN
jgi:hypothetical protein